MDIGTSTAKKSKDYGRKETKRYSLNKSIIMKQNPKTSPDESGILSSGENPSYWVDSIKPIKFNKLQSALNTEVVIVGGGISGLTIAYCLLKKGKEVVLIEDGYIGSGESGRTTA